MKQFESLIQNKMEQFNTTNPDRLFEYCLDELELMKFDFSNPRILIELYAQIKKQIEGAIK